MARTTTLAQIRNPLSDNPGREQRVRERAYQLWEADGKPHGRDVEYWERARELIAGEDSAASGPLPHPRTSPGSRRETGVESAKSHQNRGEVPNRPADQGEVKPTPGPKRRARATPKKPA
jgi:hypothetical protein